MPKDPNSPWWVYIIQADDQSYYTGITTDIDRRFAEHLSSPRKARFFYGRKPVAVVYRESARDRSQASCRELAIKRLTRQQKSRLIFRGSHS